jgi:hypothetical protein
MGFILDGSIGRKLDKVVRLEGDDVQEEVTSGEGEVLDDEVK